MASRKRQRNGPGFNPFPLDTGPISVAAQQGTSALPAQETFQPEWLNGIPAQDMFQPATKRRKTTDQIRAPHATMDSVPFADTDLQSFQRLDGDLTFLTGTPNRVLPHDQSRATPPQIGTPTYWHEGLQYQQATASEPYFEASQHRLQGHQHQLQYPDFQSCVIPAQAFAPPYHNSHQNTAQGHVQDHRQHHQQEQEHQGQGFTPMYDLTGLVHTPRVFHQDQMVQGTALLQQDFVSSEYALQESLQYHDRRQAQDSMQFTSSGPESLDPVGLCDPGMLHSSTGDTRAPNYTGEGTDPGYQHGNQYGNQYFNQHGNQHGNHLDQTKTNTWSSQGYNHVTTRTSAQSSQEFFAATRLPGHNLPSHIYDDAGLQTPHLGQDDPLISTQGAGDVDDSGALNENENEDDADEDEDSPPMPTGEKAPTYQRIRYLPDFPHPREIPPAGTTMEVLCADFPNHLQGEHLDSAIKNKWSDMDLVKHISKKAKRQYIELGVCKPDNVQNMFMGRLRRRWKELGPEGLEALDKSTGQTFPTSFFGSSGQDLVRDPKRWKEEQERDQAKVVRDKKKRQEKLAGMNSGTATNDSRDSEQAGRKVNQYLEDPPLKRPAPNHVKTPQVPTNSSSDLDIISGGGTINGNGKSVISDSEAVGRRRPKSLALDQSDRAEEEILQMRAVEDLDTSSRGKDAGKSSGAGLTSSKRQLTIDDNGNATVVGRMLPADSAPPTFNPAFSQFPHRQMSATRLHDTSTDDGNHGWFPPRESLSINVDIGSDGDDDLPSFNPELWG